MSRIRSVVCLLALLMLPAAGLAANHPILQIGSAAPDFSLPGADGKIHKLSDYASSKILVVVFTCNHCPNAQMYEGRVTQMYNDYRDKGVALVAISPNDPKAIRIDELDSSDISDTMLGTPSTRCWRTKKWRSSTRARSVARPSGAIKKQRTWPLWRS